MSQDLTVNIKATSNVPEAMDKAKSATVSMAKQVEDVQKKFSTGFKDIFLAFTAPLVILNTIISAISASMEKAKQIAESGFKTLAAGEDQYATEQEARMARFFQQQQETTQKKEESAAGKKLATEKFFEDRGFLKSSIEDPISTFAIVMGELGIGPGAGAEWIQKRAADDFEKAQAGKDAVEPMKAAGTELRKLEGLSNVVGVGANPVMEAMSAQLEEQRRQTQLLEMIANAGPGTDFTKESTPGAMKATPYGL